MNRFPRIVAHVGAAQFSLQERVVGPDDDDEEENYVTPQDDDGPEDDDYDSNAAILAELQEP